MADRSNAMRARGLRITAVGVACLFLASSLVVAVVTDATATTAGTSLWARRYDGPAHGDDTAYSVAASPDGTMVFVTGRSEGDRGDYLTVAYAASSGARLWARRYDGPLDDEDLAADVAVSPDGSEVFVTGSTAGRRTSGATIAYEAATGSTLWRGRHLGSAQAVAVSPDGEMVFVTGATTTATATLDFFTRAYDAGTGAERWTRRYDGPGHLDDLAIAVFAAADAVFVTGSSYGSSVTDQDFATIAYDASTGSRVWARRYNGPGDGFEVAFTVVGSADGSKVFVTGTSANATDTANDFATVAYDGFSGRRMWVRRYRSGDENEAVSAAVAADGSSVFVTGVSFRASTGGDFATIAYGATTGTREWVARYSGPGANYDHPWSIVASPDGSKVFVTGQSFRGAVTGEDFATFAYSASTGAVLWSSFHSSAGRETDVAWSIAASPDGSKVFVTGRAGSTQPDYATVAYAA
jgi:WD40 repeat protein